MRNYLAETRWVKALALTTATGDINGTGIDRANYQIAAFRIAIGTVASGSFTSVKIQTSNASNFASGVVDLYEADAATLTAIEAGSKTIGAQLDIRNALRYIRVQIVKGTGNVTADAEVILGHANKSPTTADGRGFDHELAPV